MLKGFTTIEIVKEIPNPLLIIEPTKLRHTRGIVEALEYAPFVKYLIDTKTKRIAVQVVKEGTQQSVRFSKPKDEQGAKAVVYQNAEMLEVIRGMMTEWEPEKKYAVPGVYSKTDKAFIFDLKQAEEYTRRINRYE